ncbi:MAG: alkaline phosphatase, partial [Arenimonas sp.]
TIAEPGSAAFLAQVNDRKNEAEIISQILAAKPDVIMGGGEQFYLPVGAKGRHGPGVRKDGRNLIKEAKAAGYTIVYTANELAALPENKTRVLGIFASDQTFNEGTEAQLAKAGLPSFQPQAPRYDEMMRVAMRILKKSPEGYLLVGNEEGTDNLSGENNAMATLDAAAGADRAIGIAMAEAESNPELTVIVASDSDNGGMNASGDDDLFNGQTLAATSENGSPVDGAEGKPFVAAADARGLRLPFVVTWASTSDSSGGTVARGVGPGAELIRGTVDSTDIYRALYLGLFGKKPD